MDSKTEDERMAEVAEEYGATLSELNSISKVEINALTMLADDNKEYAVTIAGCIENRLKLVKPERKLPILYLIDSICKNYPKSYYVQLFTQNIVSNFCDVFKSSGEKVRKSLHKLRMTWDTTKTFPQNKLNAIDKRVHEIDPNWPILNKVNSSGGSTNSNNVSSNPNTNHNQMVIGNGQTTTTKQRQQVQVIPQQPAPPPPQQTQTILQQGQQMQNIPVYPQHVQGQQQTMHVQQHNNYETFETSNGIYQQSTIPTMPAQQTHYQSQPIYNQQLQQPQHNVGPPSIQSSQHHHPQPIEQGHYIGQHQPNQQQQQLYAPHQSHQMHPNQGFQHLQPTQMSLSLKNDPIEPINVKPKNDCELDLIVDSLYGGKQCSSCSLRFVDDKKYAIHLDWHFRQNLKSDNMFVRRKWYYPLNLWVQFREINDDDIQENNNSDNNVNNDLLISPNENEAPTAPASKDDEKNTCPVCHEAFEKYWSEEEEEWRLKNARQHEDDNVYHPLCLIDMLQTNAVQ